MSLLNKFKKKFEQEEPSAPSHVVSSEASADKKKDDASTAKKKKSSEATPDTAAKKKTTKKASSAKVKDATGQAARVIVKPLQTEKNADLMVLNKYVFEVTVGATKSEIKKAFKALYDVDPLDVHIMNRKGKTVRFGRIRSQHKDWRRAIVTLKEGDRIEVFEGV